LPNGVQPMTAFETVSTIVIVASLCGGFAYGGIQIGIWIKDKK